MKRIAAVLVLVVAFVGGAVPARAAADPAPRYARLAYGPERLQVVDVGVPAVGKKVRRPAVIFLHGGGWVGGGPTIWTKEARAWTNAGWVTVNASYRLGGPTGNSHETGLAMLSDVTDVLALTRSLPNVDRRRVVVVGDSAGGHLAGWLAGRYRDAVAGLILWSPVASPGALVADAAADWPAGAECPAVCEKQRSLARRAEDLFGFSTRTTTGLGYLAAERPIPTWVAGSTDEWVRLDRNGERFCAIAGGACDLHVVPGTLHATKIRDAHPELVVSMRRWATALAKR